MVSIRDNRCVRDLDDGNTHVVWGCGPGSGWGLRREVAKTCADLEKRGYTVVLRAVGRKYRLVRDGLLDPADGEQDLLGMAAVVVAEPPSSPERSVPKECDPKSD
ncbi:MAG: hypothetical protein JWO37_3429 [Acidimicrobiales bacterium]|jgi:hypothetical protein|nr:hypothetical protein [Acidimicrobiales bacterium]